MEPGGVPRPTCDTKGVHWHAPSRKWRADLMLHGRRIYLGLHTELQDAVDARLAAEQKYEIINVKGMIERCDERDGSQKRRLLY